MQEWVTFVQAAIPKMRQVDTELPMVPPKDLWDHAILDEPNRGRADMSTSSVSTGYIEMCESKR